MSYTPNTWQTGDVVTAQKLNNMENGIANAGSGSNVFVINGEVDGVDLEYGGGTLTIDKTIDEIKAALEGGNLVLFQLNQVYNPEYQTLNDMAGIYGIQYYDFYTAGDWQIQIQQMLSIKTNSSRLQVEIADVYYQETDDPEVPEWTFTKVRKYISINSD